MTVESKKEKNPRFLLLLLFGNPSNASLLKIREVIKMILKMVDKESTSAASEAK